MHRRTLLISLMGFCGWASLGRNARAEAQAAGAVPLLAAERIARWRERVQAIQRQGILPIIDTEATYGRDIPTDYMLDQMDKHGVALVCFAPNFNDPKRGSRFSLDLANEHPDRFVPTTCDGTTDYWFRQEGPFLDVMQREARSGDYFLLGELEFRHYPSPAQYKARKFWRDITIPTDGLWGHAVFQLSSETSLAFQIHYEPEDALLAPLEKMLKAYPGAKLIWCHAGQVRYPTSNRCTAPSTWTGRCPSIPTCSVTLPWRPQRRPIPVAASTTIPPSVATGAFAPSGRSSSSPTRTVSPSAATLPPTVLTTSRRRSPNPPLPPQSPPAPAGQRRAAPGA